jgi:hypothetical protein
MCVHIFGKRLPAIGFKIIKYDKKGRIMGLDNLHVYHFLTFKRGGDTIIVIKRAIGAFNIQKYSLW